MTIQFVFSKDQVPTLSRKMVNNQKYARGVSIFSVIRCVILKGCASVFTRKKIFWLSSSSFSIYTYSKSTTAHFSRTVWCTMKYRFRCRIEYLQPLQQRYGCSCLSILFSLRHLEKRFHFRRVPVEDPAQEFQDTTILRIRFRMDRF